MEEEKAVRTGLVCEGGAMRGMFTAGVLDVFLEEGIRFDGMVGVSAGATFGCNFKSQQIGRTIRYNKRFAKDRRYCSIESLLKTGNLYNAEFCYHTLPETIDLFDWDSFLANPMKFYMVATDCDTGRPVYHECKSSNPEEMEWFRASASMPLVSKPVVIRGQTLLDGGISNAIPLCFMEHIGYERNVVILTQDRSYQKKPQAGMQAFRKLQKQYPLCYEAMKNRHFMYNDQLADVHAKETTGQVLVIQPPAPLGIHRVEHDPEALERVYQIGRSEAEKRLEEVRAFLG